MAKSFRLVGMKDGCPHIDGRRGQWACFGPLFRQMKPGEVAVVSVVERKSKRGER